jgi:AmmeMemoRadiSam system protein B
LEIAKNYNYEKAFASEILHKREHSLELQLPFLTYYYDTPKILPILVGSFAPYISKGLYPSEVQDYQDFIGALEQTIRNQYLLQNKRICFIAGVDMAHIGYAFGDREGLSEARLKLIADQDAEYLRYIKNQNQQKLFEHIAIDHDARNICGYPSIYILLDLLQKLDCKNLEVKEFEYRQAVDYQTDCAVTFAGLGIT